MTTTPNTDALLPNSNLRRTIYHIIDKADCGVAGGTSEAVDAIFKAIREHLTRTPKPSVTSEELARLLFAANPVRGVNQTPMTWVEKDATGWQPEWAKPYLTMTQAILTAFHVSKKEG